MKLYYSPGACSLAPHIVLQELGLPYTAVKVDTKAKTFEGGGDYSKINSKGYVPAIELDDGQVLTEAAVILQYLADRKPESGFAPAAGTMERYRFQEWLNFIATEIHKGFGPLWKPDSTEDEKERTRARLAARLDWLATQIQGRNFVAGQQFTASCRCLTCSATSPTGVIDRRRSREAAWCRRRRDVTHRRTWPQVREALKVEGLALKVAETA